MRWRVAAGVEVALATAAVLLDLVLPAVVIAALAGVSLLVRRQRPATLGFRRVSRPWRLAGVMLVLAAGWTLLNVGLVRPLLEHLSGERQDLSDLEDLQGDVALLALLLLLSWTLAAVVEELAFRGFLQTRVVELLGGAAFVVPPAVVVVSVLFGLLHTENGFVGVGLSTVDGGLYGVLRYRFGTLWAPVLAHGFIDTIGLVTVFAVGPVASPW